MDITLGLDVGTHQTKIALSYTPNNESIFEFVEFKSADSNQKTYLLPSIVQINEDNTLSYGLCDLSKAKRLRKAPERAPYPPKPEYSDLSQFKKIPYPPAPVKFHKVILSDYITSKELTPEYKKWQLECQNIDKENEQNRAKFYSNPIELGRAIFDWENACKEVDENYEEQMRIFNTQTAQYQSYRYFKLACFLDKKVEPFSERYTPEKLMIWYMTYVLLYAKDYIKVKFDEVFEKSVSVQMGVPSGYDNSISKEMEFRAKRLLVAARKLMDNFGSLDQYLTTTVDILESLIHMETDKRECENIANLYGFIVIPEAYAGLQSLTSTSHLKQGYMHLLVDIGGGTTDVGFFTVRENKKPDVHVVTSFHMGLNYVFEEYLKDHPGTSLHEIQTNFQSNSLNYEKYSEKYTAELDKQIYNMIQMIVTEFNRCHNQHHVNIKNIYDAMKRHPIVFCGGGSTYEQMRIKNMYFSDIHMVDKHILSIPNLVNKNIDDSIFTILATSYGLSIPLEDDIIMTDLSELVNLFCEKVQPTNEEIIVNLEYGLQDN